MLFFLRKASFLIHDFAKTTPLGALFNAPSGVKQPKRCIKKGPFPRKRSFSSFILGLDAGPPEFSVLSSFVGVSFWSKSTSRVVDSSRMTSKRVFSLFFLLKSVPANPVLRPLLNSFEKRQENALFQFYPK